MTAMSKTAAGGETKYEKKEDKKYSQITDPKTRLIDILQMIDFDPESHSAFSVTACRFITMKDVSRTINTIRWSKYMLSSRPDLDFQLVLDDPDGMWDWKALSRNVSEEFFLKHMSLPWDDKGLSSNKGIGMINAVVNSQFTWNWIVACENMKISVQSIRAIENDTYRLFVDKLSLNDSLSVEILKLFPHLDWDMYDATMSRGITMSDIESNPDIPWDKRSISMRRDFDIKMALKMNRDDVNWKSFSYNARPLDILRNPDLPWDEEALSDNLYINHGVVDARPGMKAYMDNLVRNIGLRWRMNDKIVSDHIIAYMERPTTSLVELWNLFVGRESFRPERFLSAIPWKDSYDVRIDEEDMRIVMGRRIVKYLKPYTWLIRRRRLEILIDVGFPPGVARLIAGLL